MRNLKKVLALVLVFAMMLSTCVVASAASFPDVEATYQYAEAIDLLASLNILGGYEDGTFKPENNITRAEFAKVVYVIFNGMDDVNAQMFVSDSQFNDVAKNQWFNGHVNWASENSIVGGYGDGTFLPSNNVAVKEAIKMVVTAVTDKALTYPNGYIQEARAQKLLKDVEITSTDAPATRGQVAQLAYNLLFTPSRLCLTSDGTDSYGNEIYKKNPALEFVFELEPKTGVELVATYDNTWTGSSSVEEGYVTLKIDGTEKSYEYAGDADDLFGQTLKAYFNGDNELVALVSVSGVVGTTTANKLVGDGTYDYPYATTAGEYIQVGNTKKYVFDRVFVQKDDGTYVELAKDVTVGTGTDEKKYVSLDAICRQASFNNTGKVTFIDDAEPVMKGEVIVDYTLDGVADTVIIEYQGAGEITRYSAASKVITVAGKSYSFDKAIGHEAFADADYSNRAENPVWATFTVKASAEGKVITLAPTTTVEGIVTAANETKDTAVVGGKTYEGFLATPVVTTGSVTINDAAKSTVFAGLADQVGATLKVYLDAAGYAVDAVVTESDTVYDLNLGKVIAATDSADTRGNNVKATITVVTPDGTEKVLTLDTTNDQKSGDYTEVVLSGNTAKGWVVDSYLGKTAKGDEYDENVGSIDKNTAGDDVFFAYDDNAKDYAIVDNYIHYEVDDTTGEVVRIVEITEFDAPSNSTLDWAVETKGEGDEFCYSEEWGFYTGKTGTDGEEVDSLSLYTIADSFVGMYYEEVDEELQTAYYTASNIPTFANAGEFVLIAADGEYVAMVVLTSPEAKEDNTVLGIVTGWNNVEGETMKNGKPTYRVEITMLVNGEEQKFYTEDFVSSELPNTEFDSIDMVGLTESQFAKLQLMSDGKVKVESKEIEIDYLVYNDLDFAVATAKRGNTVGTKKVTSFVNPVVAGWTINPTTGLPENNENGAPGEITLTAGETLRVCDETTFITIKGTPADVENLAAADVLFQKTTASQITAGGEIELSDDADAVGETGYYYVFAYEKFGAGETKDKDNEGALKTVFVFADALEADLK